MHRCRNGDREGAKNHRVVCRSSEYIINYLSPMWICRSHGANSLGEKGVENGHGYRILPCKVHLHAEETEGNRIN